MKIAIKSISQPKWVSENFNLAWHQSFRIDQMLCEAHTNYQHLQIFENATFGKMMVADGLVKTTEADAFIYQEMLVHVPVIMHGDVKSALVIGWSNGGVVAELLKHSNLKKVTVVEADKGLVENSKRYFSDDAQTTLVHKKVNLCTMNALEFFEKNNETFDVIIIDSFSITNTTYNLCKQHLNSNGIVVMQGGSPFMQPRELQKIQHDLKNIFKVVSFYGATIPSRLGGMLSIALASDVEHMAQPLENLTKRAAYLAGNTHYYSPEIHKASFVLPPFVQKILKS